MITINTATSIALDVLVPFGPFLRNADVEKPFKYWLKLVLHIIPYTFFLYWVFSLIPIIGTLIYILVFVSLSAKKHIKIKNISPRTERYRIHLWYFVVILIGFGGLWNFIGHTVLADFVSSNIGWATGSPFQTELAFYALGTSVAGFMAIWLHGHMITALVITKSIFWYGAAYVHIHDAIVYKNYSPLNIGGPLIGDIVYPTILLFLLMKIMKNDLSYSSKD